MNETTITYKCKPCLWCGRQAAVKLPRAARDYWFYKQCSVQVAFPDMPPEQREMLISGTHPACWDAMIADCEYEKEGA